MTTYVTYNDVFSIKLVKALNRRKTFSKIEIGDKLYYLKKI